jgi:hypothetical protein
VWADAYAGVEQTALKFAVENAGDRTALNVSCTIVQVGTNDGYGQPDRPTPSRCQALNLAAALGRQDGGIWGATASTLGHRPTTPTATIASLEAARMLTATKRAR